MSETCSACGGETFLSRSPWHGEAPICRPCMMIWYDPPAEIDRTDPGAIGELSRTLKAAGKWPWVGEFAGDKPTTGATPIKHPTC